MKFINRSTTLLILMYISMLIAFSAITYVFTTNIIRELQSQQKLLHDKTTKGRPMVRTAF